MESSVVPESVVDSAKQTLANLELIETQLVPFLSLNDPEFLADMSPLDRAHSLFLFAKTTTLLFALRLRCSGIDPNEHPVKTEIERLNLYQEKFDRALDLSKAPLRPTTLNYQAATRFIEHSLPDLTPEQKKSMRDISKGGKSARDVSQVEGPKMKYLERMSQRKRKYRSAVNMGSIQTVASEFLEKATRELLGDNAGGLKRPLQISTEDEESMRVD